VPTGASARSSSSNASRSPAKYASNRATTDGQPGVVPPGVGILDGVDHWRRDAA
jgi:hypothetical protein